MHSGHVLRTSSERRKSLLPSRREIRNRHFSFLQIKNSSTPSLPLRTDCFGTTREAGAARNLASGPEFSILFSTIKFNPITRVQRRELRLWLAPVIAGIALALRFLHGHLFMEPHAVACNAGNYVPQIMYWFGPSLSPAGATDFRSTLGSHECKPGSTGQGCEPFPQDWSTIGAAKQPYRK